MSDFEEEVRPGFTQIPNDLLEKTILFGLTKRECQVFFVIVRKTYGWQKDSDLIALSQFVELTGLKKNHVSTTLASLVLKKVITKENKKYSINEDIESWSVDKSKVPKQDKSQNGTTKSPKTVQAKSQNGTKTSPKTVTTKETNKLIQKKSLNKRDEEQSEMTFEEEKTAKKPVKRKSKKYTDGPPDFVDPENWDAFMEIREIKKAPQTERAIKMLIKKLKKFKDEGQDPDEILCNAVMGGWTSVFPLKVSGKPEPYTANRHNGKSVWDDFGENLNGQDYEGTLN